MYCMPTIERNPNQKNHEGGPADDTHLSIKTMCVKAQINEVIYKAQLAIDVLDQPMTA